VFRISTEIIKIVINVIRIVINIIRIVIDVILIKCYTIRISISLKGSIFPYRKILSNVSRNRKRL